MDRRETIKKIGSVSVCSLLGGCGYFDQSSVSIAIMNRLDEEISLQISLSHEGEEIYSNNYSLEPGSEIRENSIATGRRYTVTATVNKSDWYTHTLEMQGCEEQMLTVSILRDKSVDFGNNVCS
ncbi:hypothetical protein [Natrinema saccharevitans]|uniref:hypothetical protein n=1 Tax=Natrinema saccharevitans TaxID=301967 RepID=UPI0011156071|nr:hypothetical protein [Natrinema saccharevitans]